MNGAILWTYISVYISILSCLILLIFNIREESLSVLAIYEIIFKINKSLDTDKSTMDENDEQPEIKADQSRIGFEGGLKRMALNNTKAGMEGLDVDRINQIIEEASRGSKYYIHQQNEQDKLNVRMQSIRDAYKHLSEEQIQKSTSMMDKMAEKLEFERVLNRTIIHVDMDAYYAAVEIRDNPALSNVPMAVGGDSMLSTSNYLARKFGVRAGMPGFIGKKLCPQLVIVPCNYEKYGKVSKEIHEVFKEYDPNFCSVSLDEAYLDITKYLEKKNCLRSNVDQTLSPEEVTQEIRDKIYQCTQLTASAGIACNSLLAKICGDLNKPNGQFYLPSTIEAIKEFIVKFPIRKVSGIGNVTEQLLNTLKIFTCGDLWENRGIINLLFKPATVSFLLAVSLGIGNSWFNVSDTGEHQKSISSERTFSSGTNIEPQLCHNLCTDLERELISKDLKAQTVTLKIKTVDFVVKTRAVRLLSATNEADIIFETAWGIYKSYLNEVKDLAIRLLGVRLSNFHTSSVEAIDMQQQPNSSMPVLKSKKQGRIDHLLTKLNTKDASDKNVPKFECPICSTKFIVYNLLQIHVEGCLSEQTNVNETDRSKSSSSASVTGMNDFEFYDKDDMTMPEYNNLSDEENFDCPLKEESTKTVGSSSNLKTNKRKNSKDSSTNGKKRKKNRCLEKNRKITDFATVGGF